MPTRKRISCSGVAMSAVRRELDCRGGMNAYMCARKYGRQSHATSRIRLPHVNRTVFDGHVLPAESWLPAALGETSLCER